MSDQGARRQLPPGYEVKQEGIEWHIYKDGKRTGNFAPNPATAREMIARLEEVAYKRIKSSPSSKSTTDEVEFKQCPRCAVEATGTSQIQSVFGFRKINGKERPQSHCRSCRSSANAAIEGSSKTIPRGSAGNDSPPSQPATRIVAEASSSGYQTIAKSSLQRSLSAAEQLTSAPLSPPGLKKKSLSERQPTEELSDEAEKAVRLFRFLRQLALMRSQRVLSLDKYTDVIWFQDILQSIGCTSAFHVREDARSDIIFEIEQPQLQPPPAPPNILEDWIDQDSLNNSALDRPEPRLAIVKSSGDADRNEDQLGYDHWRDHPDLHPEWDAYVETDWLPWQQADRQAQRVSKHYERVYDAFQTLQKEAENFELLLATGLLTWKTPGNQTVCRHLLTARTNITFDSIRGSIAITAPPEGLIFHLEQDMLEMGERPARHHRDEHDRLLDEINDDPWRQLATDEFLQSWLNCVSARGVYSSDHSYDTVASVDPHVFFAPAIVFRQRTERNLVRLLEEFIEEIQLTNEVPFGVQRLVAIVSDDNFHSGDAPSTGSGDDEIYFPLPANPDQREIAERLRTRQGILVQGPPGTGKSHTIANLVCHLLATGKRILVTSHTPRALQVLREKFPEEMKALCVSVIGDDSIEARRALEESVSGITSKQNVFDQKVNERLVGDLRTSLIQVRQKESWNRNLLRSIREKDTYNHPTKFGSYAGTAQTIAHRLAAERPSFEWLYGNCRQEIEPPLSNDEALELLALSRNLSPDRIAELGKYFLPQDELPEPDTFTQWISQEKLLAAKSAKLSELKKHPAFAASSKLGDEQRESLRLAVGDYSNSLQRVINRREPWARRAAEEITSDRDQNWRQLWTLTSEQLRAIGDNYSDLASIAISGLEDKDIQRARAHAQGLIEHLQASGKLGFWIFRSKVVKNALYLVDSVYVNGERCDRAEVIGKLLYWLDVRIRLNTLAEFWSSVSEFRSANMVTIIAELRDWCEPLEEALALHGKMARIRELISEIPGLVEPQWDDANQVAAFSEVLEAGQIEERLASLRSHLHAMQTKLRAAVTHPNAHPVICQIFNSVEMQDEELYHNEYRRLVALNRGREKMARKAELAKRLATAAPKVVAMLSDESDDTCWDQRLSAFVEGWNWALASAWIEALSDPQAQQKVSEELELSQQEERKLLAQLAAAKAWGHTFKRLTDEENSHLIAWSMAMRRIGKGTGKYVEKHRKSARQHMEKCRSAIPAWIMPIHKVIETTKVGGEPYDVVIVDEASQSGMEALFLMYVAKQIVVVGDDKQISPDPVGLKQEEIDALRIEFLKGIPFNDAIGIDHSFFDQAKIRYRGTIRLKEHFRCMPEIIQFSNNLCYQDDPLIPLRQFGAGRLTPVIETRYIQNGYIDENTRRPTNMPEAEAIIERIKECSADPAYDGKTFGVISLLNTSAQAEYIEKRFKSGTILSREQIDAHKLRIGDPYVFQGDERDVIFLSMVAAPPQDGKRLPAMTIAAAERRFNVAVSRARDQLHLFHSVSLADLNPKCIRYRLLEYCLNPHVETSQNEETNADSLRRQLQAAYAGASMPPKPFDSWFEVDVFLRIVGRGYRVIPQYTMNGYSIDLIVEGMKGRLAVECDGDTWHGPDQYEHDVGRQRDLERCGMRFWRVRGSAFYLNPDRALEELWRTLDEMKIQPHTVAESISIGDPA